MELATECLASVPNSLLSVTGTHFCQCPSGISCHRSTMPRLERAAPTPCADPLSSRRSAATFYLAFRLCPSLSLRASAARRRCCTSSQPADKRVNGRRLGALEAKRLHVGRLRRKQREVRCPMRRIGTHTACATTWQRPAGRHAQWHDKMHSNVQWVCDHHGRDSSQNGCAMPIMADVLTGPEYRQSNDAGLVTLKRNSSPVRGDGIAARIAAGSTAAEARPSMRSVIHASYGTMEPSRLRAARSDGGTPGHRDAHYVSTAMALAAGIFWATAA